MTSDKERAKEWEYKRYKEAQETTIYLIIQTVNHNHNYFGYVNTEKEAKELIESKHKNEDEDGFPCEILTFGSYFPQKLYAYYKYYKIEKVIK